jgi:hypothetical protein
VSLIIRVVVKITHCCRALDGATEYEYAPSTACRPSGLLLHGAIPNSQRSRSALSLHGPASPLPCQLEQRLMRTCQPPSDPIRECHESRPRPQWLAHNTLPTQAVRSRPYRARTQSAQGTPGTFAVSLVGASMSLVTAGQAWRLVSTSPVTALASSATPNLPCLLGLIFIKLNHANQRRSCNGTYVPETRLTRLGQLQSNTRHNRSEGSTSVLI